MGIEVENNFEEYLKNIIKITNEAANEIKITELAEMQSNTPVKTGALRLSETAHTEIVSNGIKVTWGSPLIYAKKVEFEDKSYIRSTLKRDIQRIGNILRKNLKSGL
ncbi:MAG: HK97 gp10 family phage protein [Clostridium sp.]|uniref:HK97 gp10 family phage protein n=1 Tax=Clostridium sp. TaxID=1506 RepID=UPI003F2F8006